MVEINREHWLKDGEDCEKSASIHTCQAIVYVNQEMFKKERRKYFDDTQHILFTVIWHQAYGKGNSDGLLFPISSKSSFIYIIPQTG